MNKKLVARNGGAMIAVIGGGLYALIAGAAPGTQMAITKQEMPAVSSAHKSDALTALTSWATGVAMADVKKYYCSQNHKAGTVKCRLKDKSKSRISAKTDAEKIAMLRSGELRSGKRAPEQILDATMLAAHDAWAARCDKATRMLDLNDIGIEEQSDGSFTTTCHPLEVLTDAQYLAKRCAAIGDCTACTRDEDCAADFSCDGSQCLPDQPIVVDIGEIQCTDDSACVSPATCNSLGRCK